MLADNIKLGLDEYMEKRECFETKSKVFNQFNKIINELVLIIDTKPMMQWGLSIAKEIINLRKKLILYPIVEEFLDDYLPLFWDALRKPVDNQLPIPRIAIDNVLYIKEKLPCPEYYPENIKIISLEQLKDKIIGSKIYQLEESNVIIFEINYKEQKIQIPLLDTIYHKGGVPRLVAKLYFESKEHLIDAELPVNDFDLMTYDLNDAMKVLNYLGEKDLSGIELFHDLEYAFSSRDVSINLTLLTKKGLVYSPNAENSIKSGVTYHLYADHGIYSKNYFIHKEHVFVCDRGFERLFKFLIEGKTDAIKIKKENLQLFMKGYPLVLLGRFLEKKNKEVLIQKIYYLLKITGQLDQYRYFFEKHGLTFEKNKKIKSKICNFFETLHHFYPYFSIERIHGDDFTAKWLTKKLLKWFAREFKRRYRIKISDFGWIKIDPSEEWSIFNLDNFKIDIHESERIIKWLPGYIERCRIRNKFC